MKKDRKKKTLLIVDGIVNLILGILLLLFPLGMAQIVGVPAANVHLYPVVLGAVIFGIGVALFLEACGMPNDFRGLGLGGAIVINFCGAGVLLAWLMMSSIAMPIRGHIILWSIVMIVFLVGIAELLARPWQD